MSSESAFQVSERAGDAIVVVRGDTIEDFKQNLLDAADEALLACIDTFSSGVKSLDAVAAARAVGGTRVVPQAPPPQEGGGGFACPHGQRSERSGVRKDGKPWKAYFCQSRVCKPVNPDGSEWK